MLQWLDALEMACNIDSTTMYYSYLRSALVSPIRLQRNIPARSIHYSVERLNSGDNLPWFMRNETDPDPNEEPKPEARVPPQTKNQALPNNLPKHLVVLYEHLSRSPLLSPSTLRVCKPDTLKSRIATDDLALPYSRIRGRRKRGIRDAGESVGEPDDMWSWYVIAEVKEGTEGRGAIETVIRNAHRELLKNCPELPISRKLVRKRTSDGWEVLDLGDSLLHVVSREKSQTLFDGRQQG